MHILRPLYPTLFSGTFFPKIINNSRLSFIVNAQGKTIILIQNNKNKAYSVPI